MARLGFPCAEVNADGTAVLTRCAGSDGRVDTLILALFPRDKAAYDHVAQHVTVDRIAAHFGDAVTGQVTRGEMPQLPGLVYRIPGVLGAGVTASPTLDGHGKTLSSYALTLPLPELDHEER